jgi:pSer/pThr/pTyr-binding forkhead associated (FHA) protein
VQSCSRCGAQNAPDARFCSQCGAPSVSTVSAPAMDDRTQTISGLIEDVVAAGSATSAAPHGDLPSGAALLVVRRGPNAGSRFVLDAPVTTAGRHPDSDILLDDVTVSRRHAEFVHEGSNWLVRDAGSLNGTYLNRERIDSAELVVGDEVQIGKFLVVVAATGVQEAGG